MERALRGGVFAPGLVACAAAGVVAVEQPADDVGEQLAVGVFGFGVHGAWALIVGQDHPEVVSGVVFGAAPQHVHGCACDKRFDRLAAAAGLSRITFHDLRHSYATSALKAGLSPKVVSERIGHANVGFFLETYAHVLKNDDRAAAEQAASFLIGAGWDPESGPESDDKQG
jgi:hypothetical protein